MGLKVLISRNSLIVINCALRLGLKVLIFYNNLIVINYALGSGLKVLISRNNLIVINYVLKSGLKILVFRSKLFNIVKRSLLLNINKLLFKFTERSRSKNSFTFENIIIKYLLIYNLINFI